MSRREAHEMDLRDLRVQRDALRTVLDENGGRGVELADKIDTLEREIRQRESPMSMNVFRREIPEYIWWCYTCSGGVGCWGRADDPTPPPRCPDCKSNDFALVKFVPAPAPAPPAQKAKTKPKPKRKK